jgi:hypothetical protein
MPSNLIFHRSRSTSDVRKETLNERAYLVAPVVMIVQGVLNGELVTAQELAVLPETWNGVPVPLGHPMRRGVYISANAPEIVAQTPARLYNVQFKDDRLTGEVWLDVALAEELGGDALLAKQKLEQGEPVEVSTAYWRQVDDQSGTWDGVEYAGIAHDIRPDHLALLLHEEGACNWAMGCGIPRANRKCGGETVEKRSMTVNVETSLDEQLAHVYDAFWAANPPAPNLYIEKVYEDHVIVGGDPEGLRNYPYTVDTEGKVTFGEMQRVEAIYQPVENRQEGQGDQAPTNAASTEPGALRRAFDALGRALGLAGNHQAGPCPNNKPEEVEMEEKSKLIEGLLAHGRCPLEKAELEGLEVNALQRLSKACEAQPEPEQPQTNSQPPAAPAEMNDIGALQARVAELEKLATQLQGNADQEKNGLVEVLAVNERCAFSKDDLGKMDLGALRKLEQSLQPTDYSGRGVPAANKSDGVTVLAMPKIE